MNATTCALCNTPGATTTCPQPCGKPLHLEPCLGAHTRAHHRPPTAAERVKELEAELAEARAYAAQDAAAESALLGKVLHALRNSATYDELHAAVERAVVSQGAAARRLLERHRAEVAAATAAEREACAEVAIRRGNLLAQHLRPSLAGEEIAMDIRARGKQP